MNAVLRAAEAEAAETGGAGGKQVLGVLNRAADGSWGCRFLTTIDPRVAVVKLDLLCDENGVTADAPAPDRVVFRQFAPVPAPSGLFGGFGKRSKPPDSGWEVVVEFPEREESGTIEVAARGTFFGAPTPEFVRSGEKIIVRVLDDIRRTLNNVEERRKHLRVAATFALTLHPVHSDGLLKPSMRGSARTSRPAGWHCSAASSYRQKYAYVTFEDVPGLAGSLLFQVIRAEQQDDEVLVTGRYRLDLDPEAL